MTEKILQILDLTVADVQMIALGTVIFYIFLKYLDRSLFAPYMKLVDAREASTVGASEAAGKITRDAEIATAKYEEQLAAARKAAMHNKSVKVAEARAAADQIVHSAEGEAEEFVRAAKLEGAKHIETNRAVIQAEAQNLSSLIVDRILQ